MASSSVLPHLPEANWVPFQMGTYICVVEVTAYFYDWLWSILDECNIMSRAGLTLSGGVYLLSRITTAGHLLMIAVLLFAPVENCSALVAMLSTCGALNVASTSFLFFLRVRAVYLQSRYITVLFGLLWVVTVAFNTLTNASLRPVRIPDTRRCIVYEMDYFAYPCISTFLYDTFVFLAISYRLTADTAIEQNWRRRLLSVVTGKGLYRLSRALMQTGFIYYLAIILFFWVNLAMMVSPLVPVAAHYQLTTTYLAFTNIMACRICRIVSLRMMENSSIGLSSTRIAAAFELTTVSTARRSDTDLP